jgi:hypothetical protein
MTPGATTSRTFLSYVGVSEGVPEPYPSRDKPCPIGRYLHLGRSRRCAEVVCLR